MKRELDDSVQYLEDRVGVVKPFLKFDVFVPERVCQEILAAAFGATLEESLHCCQYRKLAPGAKGGRVGGVGGCEHDATKSKQALI